MCGTNTTATSPVRTCGAKRSTYSTKVSHSTAVAVDCYAGSRGEETLRRFTVEDQLVEVREIVDQWRTPVAGCPISFNPRLCVPSRDQDPELS